MYNLSIYFIKSSDGSKYFDRVLFNYANKKLGLED